ncbi:hypothetical protein FE783_20945 [Paenibacillus mesophilus]|uniref:hypothetical protein n=1 Tax=Paenibacillus mesophilus TaxID=2582849 RepID=UPI00110D5106|nr:hypothetical protein [Paenibacillus mesophilus]TMV47893.1 hypothetical protein FE783_20945 [Paenibacillus mesophilus]
MTIPACWLSREEQVQVVIAPSQNRYSKYPTTRFKAARKDGSHVFIDRQDILLEEEEKLIDELSTRSERYSIILKQLMKQGVPFNQPLQQRMAKRDEQILLQY